MNTFMVLMVFSSLTFPFYLCADKIFGWITQFSQELTSFLTRGPAVGTKSQPWPFFKAPPNCVIFRCASISQTHNEGLIRFLRLIDILAIPQDNCFRLLQQCHLRSMFGLLSENNAITKLFYFQKGSSFCSKHN